MYSMYIIFHELFMWRLLRLYTPEKKKCALFGTNYSDSYLIVICHTFHVFFKLNTFNTAFLSHMQKRTDNCIFYMHCEMMFEI